MFCTECNCEIAIGLIRNLSLESVTYVTLFSLKNILICGKLFSDTLEEAVKQLEYYINLTDVDTDDEKNRQSLRRTRYRRAIKRMSSSDSDQESKSNDEDQESNDKVKLKPIPSMSAVKKEKLVVETPFEQESEESNSELKLQFTPSITTAETKKLAFKHSFEQKSEESNDLPNLQLNPLTPAVQTKNSMVKIPSKPTVKNIETLESPIGKVNIHLQLCMLVAD